MRDTGVMVFKLEIFGSILNRAIPENVPSVPEFPEFPEFPNAVHW